MSIMYIFFFTIGLLGASILLSIISWFIFAKILSRISFLEKAIEQKSAALDILRKERAVQAQSRQIATVEEDDLPAQSTPESPQATFGESIQIVRNVHGHFERSETPMGASHTVQALNDPEPNPPAPPFPQEEPSLQKAEPSWAKAMIIPIFSPAQQGPDFNFVYSTLSEFIKKRQDPLIVFDFNGITRLEHAEIDYIDKLNATLIRCNRSLLLVNCQPGIAASLRGFPRLGPLVRQVE